MRLRENDERDHLVADLVAAKKLIAGFDEAMAVVDCNPQRYRLYNDQGELVYERPAYRIP